MAAQMRIKDFVTLDNANTPVEAGLESLHHEIASCSRCNERGYLAIPRPIDRGRGLWRVWLVGQAPGLHEGVRKIAFGGPAGRTLMKWLATTGLTEEEVRNYFYLSAITKCYPGRTGKDSGDRNPTPLERALCRPYLLRELALLRPETVILVGSTAIKEVYGDKTRLEEIIGSRVTLTLGTLYSRLESRLQRAKEPAYKLSPELKSRFNPVVPVELYHLPHPSGASTWLNVPQNRLLLAQSLADLKERVAELAVPPVDEQRVRVI